MRSTKKRERERQIHEKITIDNKIELTGEIETLKGILAKQ